MNLIFTIIYPCLVIDMRIISREEDTNLYHGHKRVPCDRYVC